MRKVDNIPDIPGFDKRKLEQLRSAANEELNKPPRIALIGETGVGKTSTINAMFNTGLSTSHVKACTQESQELRISVEELSGQQGSFIVYDMPGLGEDVDADEKHKATYSEVLKRCDVAVWVLDGSTRQFTQTQIALRDIVSVAMGDLNRLVIGVNKIDVIRPGVWNQEYNLPSSEQKESIRVKVEDVLDKIQKVCAIPKDRVIPYSAEQWYRLPDLLGAMLEACPEDRAWVLYDRANLADFLKKVSPDILKSLNN
jgi:uncharacterized protein